MRRFTPSMLALGLLVALSSIASAQSTPNLPAGGGSAVRVPLPGEKRPSITIDSATLMMVLSRSGARWWAPTVNAPRKSSFYVVRRRAAR